MANEMVLKLILQTDSFDKNIEKSTSKMGKFKGSMHSAAKDISSFNTVMTAVKAGLSVFNKVIGSSQTLSSGFGIILNGAKTSVDQFFTSIAKGDFSIFTEGLKYSLKLSKKLTISLDDLSTTQLWNGLNISEIDKDIAKLKVLSNDQEKSEEDRIAASDEINKLQKKKVSLINEEIKKQREAAKLTFNTALTKSGYKGGEYNEEDIVKIVSIGLQEETKGLLKQYKKNPSSVDVAGQLGGLRYINGLKVFVDLPDGDKSDLQNYVNLLTAANKAEEQLYKNQLSEISIPSFNSGVNHSFVESSEDISPVAAQGSLSELNERLRKEEELLDIIEYGTTSWQIQYNVVSRLKSELEKIEDEMRKMDENKPELIKPNQPKQIALTEEELGKLNTTLKTYVSKVKESSEETKKGGASAVDWVEAAGNVTKNIGKACSESTAAWLNYAGNIVSSVGQMLPALASVFGVTAALGIAEQSKLLFPMNIIAMATTGAALVAAIASIPKFAAGGIVTGNNFTGDRLLARVNSGEMILNKAQQSNLFEMINNGMNYSNTPQMVVLGTRVRGKDIEITGNNYRKIQNKLG